MKDKTITSKSGKTITLRPPAKKDTSDLYQFAKDLEAEDTFILLNREEPVNREEEKQYVANLVDKIKKQTTVYLLAFDQKKLIGTCGIDRAGKRQNHVGRFGIAILKDYRSDGIGAQLAQAVMNIAKTKLGITQIILDCFANNQVACQFYNRLGFQEYGRQPEAISFKGERIDKLLFFKNLG